jgi:chaperone required for assembly of F1-ATPase
MKRFYTNVSVGPAKEGVHSVLLDGKPIKTPKRAGLALPTRALAEAVAGEWRDQGDKIVPAAMPLTKLANTAIDRVFGRETDVVDKIVAYANDHLCYRASGPTDLVARQSAAWDSLLAWAGKRFGAKLVTGTGVSHIAQPEEAIAALRSAVAAYDGFVLAGLHNAVTILGSLVLGLAVAEGRLDAAEAFALSQLDERYQAENWGEDAVAAARSRTLSAELSAAVRFMVLARTRN